MKELDGPVRPYAWGSRSFLAGLRGAPVPSPEPEAELWLGAHPGAPSLVAGTPLGELIEADPSSTLGPAALDRFGNRLPYLLKLLAADEPLSIQVHPDAAQAQAAFEAGRPGYTDPYPKPELLVALTPFEALCGFRDPLASAEELDGLGVPALAPVVAALRAGDLRTALSTLLTWPAADRETLVGAVRHPLAVRLAQHYPGDVGVVVALLLNHLSLRPGEAIFMPAGNVHAYLGGAGVEIMGASDNVLRAGLTVKAVDAAELMRLVRYEVLPDPVFPAVSLGDGLVEWQPPVAEFSLVQARTVSATGPVTLPGAGGPRIIVCVRGTAILRTSTDRALPAGTDPARAGAASAGASPAGASPAGADLTLAAGRAAFVAATEPAVQVLGDAEVFQAAPGF